MNAKQLKRIMPFASSVNINKYLPELNKLMPQFGINTALRQAHFIAQLAHESGSLNYCKELASGSAYEGRKDLGNIIKGDGVKFKGRGLIQLTGRLNYSKFQKWLGNAPDIITHPEYLEQPHLAVMVSCWFWQTNGLNELADQDSFISITRKINGGTNGLDERRMFLSRAKKEIII